MELNFKFAVIAALTAKHALAYSSSLSDCESFASNFSNTCGGTYSEDFEYQQSDWVTSASGSDITCTAEELNQFMMCPNGDGRSASCVLTRKNCITCSRDADDNVYIRIQTNGIPSICYGTNDNQENPQIAQIDVTLRWNYNVLILVRNYNHLNFETEEAITALICDAATTNTSNVPAHSELTNNSGVSIDGLVGVSTDNVLLYNALKSDGSGGYQDGLYGEDNDTDLCLHQVVDFKLVQRSLGSCMKSSTYRSTTRSPEMCSEEYDCYHPSQHTDWALDQAFPSVTAVPEEVMGIAFDGHIIVGPYNEDGELYTCSDLDGCNGTFLSDNSYAYVMSRKFPYIVGCWGPATDIQVPVSQSCAIDACQKGAMANVFFATSVLVAALATFSF